MIINPKAGLLVAAACAAAIFSLSGCNKSPGKDGSGPDAHASTATATDAEKSLAAQTQAPPLPDPSRTDPEAVAMRKKYVEWRVAQVKAANDAAAKQRDQFYGPAPKGNYGRMADGLPPAGKN